MPNSFAVTPNGVLLIADGFAPVQRWAGMSPQAEAAGVAPPLTALSMAGTTFGNIIGTYYAWCRFVDKYGNFSNLSPISAAYSALGKGGNVTGATNTSPIRIRSDNHGLTTGATVTITGVLGNTNANGTRVITVVDSSTFSLNGTTGNANYTSGGAWKSGNAGFITNATNAVPIRITSNGHGLSNGLIVQVANVRGNTAANGTWTVFVIDVNNFELVNSVGSANYVGGGTWAAGVGTITFSGVPVPVEPKVVSRQILRTTDGQVRVAYIDVDSTNLTATSFTSTKDDDTLAAQTAVPLLDVNDDDSVNVYTVPPNWKTCLAQQQDRMFYAVDAIYSEGNVAVTNGSTTVTGLGTEWGTALAGRFLYVDGAPDPYEIGAVNASAQTLTLTTAYLGPTSAYSLYSIRPAPGERRLVYYSLPGLYEAVPPTNSLSLQEDGDELTGLMPYQSFVYILERRHIYRMTFQNDPAVDGAVYLASRRGCISPRCFTVVEDTAYLLDEQGVWAFAGGDGQPVSQEIQTLFRRDARSPYRINWSSQRYFHALLNPAEEVVRFFVALSGDSLPRHALAYAFRLKRWWVEEYAVPVGSSCVGRLGPANSSWQLAAEQMFGGSGAGRILALGAATLDGPTRAGTTSGAITAATRIGFTDAAAIYARSGLVGSPVTITAGRGKGQTRIVTAVSGTTVTVDRPWAVRPDAATSRYQLGGVPWRYLPAWKLDQDEEGNVVRSLDVAWETTAAPMTMDVRRYDGRETSPTNWGATRTADENNGVATTVDDPDAVVALDNPTGWVSVRIDRRRERGLESPDRVRLELRGVTGEETLTINRVAISGVGR